jgi:hypothetical protein
MISDHDRETLEKVIDSIPFNKRQRELAVEDITSRSPEEARKIFELFGQVQAGLPAALEAVRTMTLAGFRTSAQEQEVQSDAGLGVFAGSGILYAIDTYGFPTEASVEAIRDADYSGRGGRWLCEVFPKLARLTPYASIDVTDAEDERGRPCKKVIVATQGWSGAEALVGAVLSNPLLNALYYAKWERGGRHTFLIPPGAVHWGG